MNKLLIKLLIAIVSLIIAVQHTNAEEVTFWISSLNQQQVDVFDQTVVQPFNESQSKIRVKATLVQDMDRQMKLALSSGKGPDVVFTAGPTYLVQYIKNRLVLPLDDYAQKFGWDKTFLKATLDLQRFDGKLYGLPDAYESLFLYYNKTLFEKNRWQPPKTLTELEKIAEQAKSQGITPFSAGCSDWRGTHEWFITIVLNHVAGPEKVAQALKGEIPWTSKEFADAIQLLDSWWKKGWFGDNYYSLTGAQAVNNLAEGKAAMEFSGSWAVPNLREYFSRSGQQWDWVPIPTLADGVPYPLYTLGIGGTISLNKSSKNPDDAAEFVAYLYKPETFLRWTAAQPSTGMLFPPVKLQAADLEGMKLDERMTRQTLDLAQALEAGRVGYTTWTFWPDRTEQLLIDGIEKVWAGKLSVSDYLKQVDAQYQKDLRDKRVPPIMEPASSGVTAR